MSFSIIERPSPAQLMTSLFPAGSDISYQNVNFTGADRCAALFSGASSVVTNSTLNFPESGLILGTGLPISLYGQDGTESYYDFSSPGDLDIAQGSSFPSFDACILEFEFQCNNLAGGSASLDYVFSSDEYKEQIDEGAGYADLFAIILNGENIATIPGTSDPVGVYTVNHLTQTDYFVYNDPRPGQAAFPGFEPDGFTVGLEATGSFNIGWNTMKIGIVDVQDQYLDSWLFLKEGSFDCTVDPLATWPPTPAPTNSQIDDCTGSACGGEHSI